MFWLCINEQWYHHHQSMIDFNWTPSTHQISCIQMKKVRVWSWSRAWAREDNDDREKCWKQMNISVFYDSPSIFSTGLSRFLAVLAININFYTSIALSLLSSLLFLSFRSTAMLIPSPSICYPFKRPHFMSRLLFYNFFLSHFIFLLSLHTVLIAGHDSLVVDGHIFYDNDDRPVSSNTQYTIGS